MLNKGENRIGTCILQASGQNAVCVTYNSSTSIVVKLDNGNLIQTTWKTFSKGLLKATEDTRSRVGQKKMQNCGRMITCIAYRTATDCDIKYGRRVQAPGLAPVSRLQKEEILKKCS